MSASNDPSGAMVEVPVVETGHCTVTRIAVVPTLAAAKFTLKILERGFCEVKPTGEPLSSRI